MRTLPSFHHRLVVASVACVLGAVAVAGSSGCSTSVREESAGPTRTVVSGTRRAMDLETAVARADAIVIGAEVRRSSPTRGRVVSQQARQRQRDAGLSDTEIDRMLSAYDDWVFTTAEFRIDEVLKGEFPRGTVDILEAGGTVGNHTFEAPERPRLIPGGRQAVFLVRDSDGAWGAIAVFKITGKTATTHDLDGRELTLTLDDLSAVVKAHKDDPWPREEPGAGELPPSSPTTASPAGEQVEAKPSDSPSSPVSTAGD